MWNIINKISSLNKKSSVIITTHSMEEAEALCTKMGIMVKGEFKCFGPATHIKDKYGTGYELEFKIKALDDIELQTKISTALTKGLQLPLTVSNCQDYLKQTGNKELAAELNADGIGSEFLKLEEQGQFINEKEFF